MTNAEYRKAKVASAELRVIKAEVDLLFAKFLGDKDAADVVLDELFSAGSSVERAIKTLDSLVAECDDIYSDVK